MHAIAIRIFKYHENPWQLDPSAIPVQCITVMINYVLSFSAVQTYDLSYTHLHSSPVPPYGYITNSQWWLATCSSVGRALHQHCRGHEFKSCSGLNFVQGLISQLLKLCLLIITAMINHIFIYFSAVQLYDLCTHSHK